MQRYACIDRAGRLIGTVDACDGDTAWLLAQLAAPAVDHLEPADAAFLARYGL